MDVTIHSLHWAIVMSLFLGGLGLPIPENPLLLGGGYAVSQQLIPLMPSLLLWYLAIIVGDLVLFGFVYWIFTRPSLLNIVPRIVRQDRLDKYQEAFLRHGGWMLFLARFTFGIRGLAYVAAGAAHYPLGRFLLVDGVSVAFQVLLFVAIGLYAGESIELAKATAHQVVIFLTGATAFSILISLGASYVLKRFTRRNS